MTRSLINGRDNSVGISWCFFRFANENSATFSSASPAPNIAPVPFCFHDHFNNLVCFILQSMSLVIMRVSVSLRCYRVLAVMYGIWIRTIFGPLPPYVLKYNALRFGAESISVFKLIPEHVVTVVLEKVSLKAGTCAVLGNCCVVFQNIVEKSKKILGLQISVSSCHFLTLRYRSPQHPFPIYHQPMIRLQGCDDDVLLGGTGMLHYAPVVWIKPRRWKSEINTSHAHSVFTYC